MKLTGVHPGDIVRVDDGLPYHAAVLSAGVGASPMPGPAQASRTVKAAWVSTIGATRSRWRGGVVANACPDDRTEVGEQMTVIDMSRPTRGLRLAASWRWHLARALDAAHLPVFGGFALIGRCVVGTRAWFLILAAVLLTQAACGSCPLVVATHWLRHGKSDGRSRRGGLVARVFRRPAPRMVAAAFAIVLIATHTGL